MRTICFVDVETTGLDPRRHEVWEIAVIRREADGSEREHLWQIRPPEGHMRFIADPEALRINRYHERIAVPAGAEAADMLHPSTTGDPFLITGLAELLCDVLNGAMMVGSNPAFDAAFLHRLLGLAVPPWHYRTVDIATLAVGHLYGQAYTLTKQQCDAEFYARADRLLEDGWKSYELSRLMGIEPPKEAVAHTALGDARWARDVYDAITKADYFYTATDEQLGEMAGQALSNTHRGAK